MTELEQLLEDATADVRPQFTAEDVERRVQRRRRVRVSVGAALVVLLICGIAAATIARDDTRHSRVATRPESATSPLVGRWVALTNSEAGNNGPRGRGAELRFEADGQLRGFDGCTDLSGRWAATAAGGLRVTDLSPPSEDCEATEASAARVLRRVLAGAATTGPFEQLPDSLRLGVGDDFVAFVRDVAYGTPTDPATSGEVFELGDDRFEKVADASSVVPSVLPAEIRFQRWRATNGDDEVQLSRTLGGMPFSARAIVLATTYGDASATEVEIGGRPGAVTISPAGVAVSVSWAPHDDVTLTLRLPGVTVPEAVRLAESVRYRRGNVRSESLTTARGLSGRDAVVVPGQVAASGNLASGVPWKFVVYGSATDTCTQLLLPSGASGECGPPDDEVEVDATRVLGEVVVHGSVPEPAATVRIEWDGGAIDVPATRLAAFPGRRWFGTTGRQDVVIRRVLVRDERGVEIARQEPVPSGGAIGAG